MPALGGQSLTFTVLPTEHLPAAAELARAGKGEPGEQWGLRGLTLASPCMATSVLDGLTGGGQQLVGKEEISRIWASARVHKRPHS